MHPLRGQDLWKLGDRKFLEKNTIAARDETARRRKKKTMLRKCIMKGIEAQVKESDATFAADVDYTPSW